MAANFLSNPVGTLFEAPAVFLLPLVVDGVLEPILASLAIRNLITVALDPPPSGPGPAGATVKPTAKTVTLNVGVIPNVGGIKTGTALATGMTANGTVTGTPGSKAPSANIRALSDKPGDLGLKHQTAKTAKK